MILLKNISKHYKNGKVKTNILKDINLEFNKKEFTSILGPSGCGKTTLLNIIGTLDKQSNGDLIINGTNTKDFKEKDFDAFRNNSIGFIFQKFNLIPHLTVYANVEVAIRLSSVKRKERKKRVLEVLDLVGLKDHKNKKPNQLSGGEAQRVAIARAIVNKPDIILADEPTGSLDSTNSVVIMEILKKISKDHLVILITHNQELAKQYSDRIIYLNDGQVKEEIKHEVINESIKIPKVHMSLGMTFGLSIKNIYSKFIRTFLTILAGCLGIVAVTLVISVSKGVDVYIDEVQSSALESSPIVINSRSITTVSGNGVTSKQAYPDMDSIILTTTISNYEEVNNINNDFIDYINKIDPSHYSIFSYNRSITMRFVKKVESTYSMISGSNLTEMIDDYEFMKSNYDLLEGKIPTEYNEIALVIDRYNCVPASIINTLRLGDSKSETIEFKDIINQKYKLIENDNYYYYDEANSIYRTQSNYQTLYNNATTELNVVGIIREKKNTSSLYSPGLIYTTKLTDFVIESASKSSIVIDQIKYGLTKDVTTNKPYERSVGSSYTYSEQYQYDSDLITYGKTVQITRIYIYSLSFQSRAYIEDYVKNYANKDDISNITYNDYMSSLTNELTAFIEVVSKILLFLALISLIISSIMIAIITHISVIERTKEIGILRSIGAKKKDIINIFCAETAFIGLASGIIGILVAYLVRTPINNTIIGIIKKNISNASKVTKTSIIEFDFNLISIMLVASILLTVAAGLIPAIRASFKKCVDTLRSE